MSDLLQVRCAWCARDLGTRESRPPPKGPRISHGICVACLGGLLDVPLTDVHNLTAHDVDGLPFGLIALDGAGRVVRYNRYEERMARLDRTDVLGRHFFTEVAPCTARTEFETTYRRLLDAGGGEADFEFIFRFTTGHRLVRIRMIVDPDRDEQLIMIRSETSG